MANETTVQTSCIQENHEADECRENIPPEATSADGTSKLEFQVEDVEGYSSTQPNGKNVPLSDTCTFSTPAPTSSNGGIRAKSRLSGLQSALTPILKFLNISNKCPSPDVHGSNPNPTDPVSSFDNTTTNCQKSAGGSSQHPNSDFSSSQSGQSLGDTNAPVPWLHEEFLPEITLLDVTCNSTMQLTKNDSPLPDSVPSTPATTRSVSTLTTLQPSQLSASSNLNTTTQIPCPQTKTLGLLQSNVSGPKAECQATDQASSVSNTTETTLAVNQNNSAGNTGGLREMQDITFDRNSLQKSSDNTVLDEADTTNFCLQNNTFNTKTPSEQKDTITVSETSSSDSHKTTKDKPSPPKVCNAKENHSTVHPSDLLKHNGTIAKRDDKMVDIPENIDAPLRWLDDRYFPEITLLNVTRDSEFSPGGEKSSLEVTQDISPVDSLQNSMPSSELSGQVVAEPGTLDRTQSEDLSGTLDGNATHILSSLSEQSDKCVGENTPKASLEATRDISLGSVLEDSPPSLDLSGQNMAKIQTSAEDTQTHPANVTRDISSSSDMSVQCAASQLSTSDMQCNTSSKNVTSELDCEPVVASNTVEAKNEELLPNHDTELATKVPQPSPKRAGSVNSTFTFVEQSNLSASTNVNTTAPISCPQNKTLDLPQSNVKSPQAESDAKDQAASFSKDTTETSPCINQNCSAAKASGSCDVQNITFDRHSLQKSSGNTISGEAGAATFCLQNNTFDTKSPKQNGTITMSEMILSDSHQNTLDKSSPPKVCNATSSPKDNNSEVQPPEPPKHRTTAGTDPSTKMGDTPESTFEANPAVEVASGAARRETKDHSQSSLPLRDGLSDSLGHQSMDTEEDNKANTLNLDDTLDLRADSLITSTPMINCKMFNFNTEREEGKTIGAQKKLYGDGPSKPDRQVQSDVPSNIVCDRKTFLTQPTAKSLVPPLKASSQLLKFKPASILPGKFEPLMSGLPMTRQRTQAEALRNTAASDAPHVTTGISSSYNLRATTTGSKQPNPGLQKPRLSSIPSGIHRAAPGLRPPSARSNAPASSSTEKHRGPTASNPATKILQAKKHPLTRGEALPTAKRKKMDAPSVSAEASTSSCDAANRTKNLKQPAASQRALPAKIHRDEAAVPTSATETSTSCNAVGRARALKQPVASHRALLPKPQGHGCAKCVVLEQQLEMKSEEIRRLKEELLKYSNQRKNADMDSLNT